MKQSSSLPSVQGDKALNQFWELLDSAMGAIPQLIQQVAILEAMITSGTDPSSGMRYASAWAERSPSELAEAVWTLMTKALSSRVGAAAEGNSKLRKALVSADWLRTGLDKVSQESKVLRRSAFEMVGSTAATNTVDDAGLFEAAMIVDRLKQIIK